MLKESELKVHEKADGTPRTPDLSSPEVPVPRRRRAWLPVVVIALVAGAAIFGLQWMRHQRAASATKPTPGSGGRGGGLPVPVTPATVTTRDVPIFLDGLGTVQAFNTVTVHSRVDGQIKQILFKEGQEVQEGDLLAQIDPAPFQAQLDQNMSRKAVDEAQLGVAKLTLKRDAELLGDKILSQQEYDTQAALVTQLEAAVQADQAAVDTAKVQLDYTHVTSPMEGRVGIRLVDQGNVVRANDSNGIVVITQLRPISVVFTLPEQRLNSIQEQRGSGEPLTVVAVDRNNSTKLSEGKLEVIDNQIDTTTGTIRLKATFSNNDLRLWPGQFINARLLLKTWRNGTVVPAQVIQRGPDGAYAFVIKDDGSVAVRQVKVALIEQGQALIEEGGLLPGERVALDNQFKLQPGSRVKIAEGTKPGATNAPPRPNRAGKPAP